VSGARDGSTRLAGAPGANATGANAHVMNYAATVSGGFGGATVFQSDSTGGNATINNNGATVSGAGSGSTVFELNSTAGNATLIANGGMAPATLLTYQRVLFNFRRIAWRFGLVFASSNSRLSFAICAW
jgi:hypothetical protein